VNIAILLRGQHFLDNNTPKSHGTNPINLSYLDLHYNFKHMILLPLLNEGHKIEFFISTFSSKIQDSLLKITDKIVISPIEKFNQTNYQQKDIIVKGLNIIPKNKFDVSNRCLNIFKQNVLHSKNSGVKHFAGGDLHDLVNYAKHKLSYKFCFKTYYSTNTSHDHPYSNNPVYIQHNRPYYGDDVKVANLLNPITLM
jgi:hypothetical protein